MKKFLILFFAFFLVIVGSLSAESGPMGTDQKLLKVEPNELGLENNAVVLCGEYLLLIPAMRYEDYDIPDGLGYQTEVWAPPDAGGKVRAWIFLPKTKFRISVGTEKTEAMAEFRPNREEIKGRVIRAGEKYYAEFDPDDVDYVNIRLSPKSFSRLSDRCMDGAKKNN